VAVGSHVSLGGKTRPQVRLRILHGNQEAAFRSFASFAVVEHVLVCVDQAGQNRRLAEVDHLRSSRNPDLGLGPDLSDSVTRKNHHLFRQHPAGLAVEQASGTNRDRSRRRRALQDAAVRADARGGTRPAPTRRMHLRPNCAQRYR
jgi:hypothetical protein